LVFVLVFAFADGLVWAKATTPSRRVVNAKVRRFALQRVN
jgi:hypothetical protein